MTHGVGSIGGGGGGGFSGGGFSFSHTHYASHSSRRRSGSVRDNDDNAECCCAICYLVAFLLCLVQMKPRTRIILTWVYIVTGSVTCGILVAKHYNTFTIPVSPTDMRKVDVPPTAFCESVVIDSTSQLKTYVADYQLIITQEPVLEYNKSVTTSLARNTYEYWGFYLLKNSQVELSMRGSFDISLYVIIGDDNFNNWLDDPDCIDCFDMTIPLTDLGTLKQTVSAFETDQYYFVFYNTDDFIEPPSSLKVNFRVKRTRYVLSADSLLCYHDFDCSVDLDMRKPDNFVIIDVPTTASFDDHVSITCKPRIYMYLLLFFVCPSFLGLIITCLILRCKKKKTGARQRSSSQIYILSNDDRVRGVASGNTTSTVAPPSYSEAPPSYDETISVQRGT